MKKIIIACLSLLVLAGSIYAQGTVFFVTRTIGVTAQVRDTVESGGALLSGGGFYAQLWSATGNGQAEASLAPASPLVNFRTSANAGYVQESGTPVGAGVNVAVNTTVTVTPSANGPVTIQLRAWSAAFPTYAAALAAFQGGDPSAHLGKSGLFDMVSGGGLNPPSSLTQALGFQLVQAPVPEPSTIALGAFGVLAAWMIRRRK